jgi:hypothetical protein
MEIQGLMHARSRFFPYRKPQSTHRVVSFHPVFKDRKLHRMLRIHSRSQFVSNPQNVIYAAVTSLCGASFFSFGEFLAIKSSCVRVHAKIKAISACMYDHLFAQPLHVLYKAQLSHDE